MHETKTLQTKVKDAQGHPKVVWHFTNRHIDRFHPLTHFGTLATAQIRMWDKSDIHGDCFYSETNPVVFYPCFLDIRHPLPVDDVWRGRYMLFSKESLAHSGVLGWKEICACFEPVSGTSRPPIAEVRTELENGGLFESYTKLSIFRPFSPSQETEIEKTTRDLLVLQRSVLALESHGYDGLVYSNYSEETHSISWVSFRDSQVYKAAKPLEFYWSGLTRPCIGSDKLDLRYGRQKGWVERNFPIPQVEQARLQAFMELASTVSSNLDKKPPGLLADLKASLKPFDSMGVRHTFQQAAGQITPVTLPEDFHADRRYHTEGFSRNFTPYVMSYAEYAPLVATGILQIS